MTEPEAALIDVEGRQAKIALMFNEKAPKNDDGDLERLIEAKPARKPRSDKGVPKGPKKPPESGCITAAQAARLRDLIDTKQSRLAELDAVRDEISDAQYREAGILGAVDKADAELSAYLLELQGKGK